MRVHIGAIWRIRGIDPCATAMRPYVKLLRPLVITVGPEALCFRFVRPSVCACVCAERRRHSPIDLQSICSSCCRCCRCQVYRNGKELSPSCIIINSRTEPRLFITPGPAAYAPWPADVSSRHSRPPAFSIARAEAETARRNQLNATPGQRCYCPYSSARWGTYPPLDFQQFIFSTTHFGVINV